MAWKLRRILKGAPKGSGAEVVAARLEEYEQRMRDALDEPMDDKRNNELTWPTFRLHYERNRFLYDQCRQNKISSKLIDHLVKKEPGKYDKVLIARWKKPGYERLCSLAAITKSNTNFRTTSVCRTPLKHRTGQITPSVMTGCVSCASGDGGPIWWNDPIPDIVKKRIVAIDPGKAALLENGNTDTGNDAAAGSDSDDEKNEEILKRARALKASICVDKAHDDGDKDSEIMERARALKESIAPKASQEEEEHDVEIMRRVRALKESTPAPQQENEEVAEEVILERAQALKESMASKEEEEHDTEIMKRARVLKESKEEEDHDAEIMRRARALRDTATRPQEPVDGEGEEASPPSALPRSPAEGALRKRVLPDDISGVQEEVRKRPRAHGKET